MAKIFICSVLCAASIRDDAFYSAARAVPRPVSAAVRKANGNVATCMKALLEQEAEVAAKASAAKEAEKAKKEQLEALERRTRDLHEAEMQTRDAFLASEAALAQHSSSNAAYLAAADVWRRRDDEVRAAELELEAAAEAVETQRAKRQELEVAQGQLDEKKARRDDLEQTKDDQGAELERVAAVKADKMSEHEELEAVVQTARKALEQHELELDGASTALEAAEQELNQARGEIHIVETQHQEEKKAQEMLLLVRDSILTFYKKLDELSESMEAGGNMPAPERLKSDVHLKPAFESYNDMVRAFHQLHSFDLKLYSTISEAVAEIKRNTFSTILLECDPGEELEKEATNSNDFTQLQEKCGLGLWTAVNLQRLKFPAVDRAVDEWWDEMPAPK